MNIGVIGAGNVGGTLAEHLAGLDHEIFLSNRRGPNTLRRELSGLGHNAHAASVPFACERGEVVFEAIPFGNYRDIPPDHLTDTIVVSISNYRPERDGEIEMEGLTQTELVARHLEGSTVVKAFNTIRWEELRDQADPDLPLHERRVIPMAGDDEEAKEKVAELIRELGFAPLDVGGLREGGGLMEPGQPLFDNDLTVEEARELIDQRIGC